MRGNQEAYILVKVKDGRQFVCALNRPQKGKKDDLMGRHGLKIDLNRDVLWQ